MSFDHRRPKIDPIFMGTPTAVALDQPQPTPQPETPKANPTFVQSSVDCDGREKLNSVFTQNPEGTNTRSKLMAQAAETAIAVGAVKASDGAPDVQPQNASVLNAGLEEDANGPAPQAATSDAPSIGPAPNAQDDQTPVATGGSRFNLGYLGTSSEPEADDARTKLIAKNRFGLNDPDFAKWWLFHHSEFEYDLKYQDAVKPALAPLVLSEARQNELAGQHFQASSTLSGFTSFELKHDNTLTAYTHKNQPIKLEKDKTVRGALLNDSDYDGTYFFEMARLYAAANAPKGETAEARGLTFALNTGELSKATPRAAQMVFASVLAAREQGINPKIILSYKDPTIAPETLEGDLLAAYLEKNKSHLLASNPQYAAGIDLAIAFAKNPSESINMLLSLALKPAPAPEAPAPEAAAPVAGTTAPDPSAFTPQDMGNEIQKLMQAETQKAPTEEPASAAAAPADIALGDASKPAEETATSILTAGRHQAREFIPDPKTNVPVSPPVAKAEEPKPAAPQGPLKAPYVISRGLKR